MTEQDRRTAVPEDGDSAEPDWQLWRAALHALAAIPEAKAWFLSHQLLRVTDGQSLHCVLLRLAFALRACTRPPKTDARQSNTAPPTPGSSACCRSETCCSSRSRTGASSESLLWPPWRPGRSCPRSTLQSAGGLSVPHHTCMLPQTMKRSSGTPGTSGCCPVTCSGTPVTRQGLELIPKPAAASASQFSNAFSDTVVWRLAAAQRPFRAQALACRAWCLSTAAAETFGVPSTVARACALTCHAQSPASQGQLLLQLLNHRQVYAAPSPTCTEGIDSSRNPC